MASTLEDSSIPLNEGWKLLLDFKNAFNCISREAMFVDIRARVPSCLLSLSVVMAFNQSSAWAMRSSEAVVVSNKAIHWVPWGLL